MKLTRLALFALCVASLALCGCSDDNDELCVVGTAEGCGEGHVCEVVVGSDVPACFSPVVIEGDLFDALDSTAVEGAQVVALDANGGARTTVAISNGNGSYALTLAVARDADGQPVAERVTLRVSAASYQAFPLPPRMSLPLQLEEAVLQDGRWVLDSAATDVALLPLSDDGLARHSITLN